MRTEVRICVIGNAGSGKSTLAKALGRRFDVPVYHLDRHLLTGDYEKLPAEEYARKHAELISGESWIIDGNYKKAIEERFKRATLVVFLDVGRAVTLPRVLMRNRKGGQAPDTIPDGAKRGKLSREFFIWTLGYSRRERMRELRLQAAAAGVPFIALKRAKLDALVERVAACVQR